MTGSATAGRGSGSGINPRQSTVTATRRSGAVAFLQRRGFSRRNVVARISSDASMAFSAFTSAAHRPFFFGNDPQVTMPTKLYLTAAPDHCPGRRPLDDAADSCLCTQPQFLPVLTATIDVHLTRFRMNL